MKRNTRKFNLYVSTLTDIFLNNKRINVREQKEGRNGGKIEWKLLEFNTRAVS
jgi:hypothetical protein